MCLPVCVCVCLLAFFFQSNVIEAAPDMKRESEKEWYFGNADKERRGPFSYEEVGTQLMQTPTNNLEHSITVFKT